MMGIGALVVEVDQLVTNKIVESSVIIYSLSVMQLNSFHAQQASYTLHGRDMGRTTSASTTMAGRKEIRSNRKLGDKNIVQPRNEEGKSSIPYSCINSTAEVHQSALFPSSLSALNDVFLFSNPYTHAQFFLPLPYMSKDLLQQLVVVPLFILFTQYCISICYAADILVDNFCCGVGILDRVVDMEGGFLLESRSSTWNLGRISVLFWSRRSMLSAL